MGRYTSGAVIDDGIDATGALEITITAGGIGAVDQPLARSGNRRSYLQELDIGIVAGLGNDRAAGISAAGNRLTAGRRLRLLIQYFNYCGFKAKRAGV